MKTSYSNLSWADRFSLIDHFSPSDDAIMSAFGLTAAELVTARRLRAAGAIKPAASIDYNNYKHVFGNPAQKPETATKRSAIKHVAKRGRKGEKIAAALLSAPTTPMPVDQFMSQHDISLPVLRQAKRFIAKLDPALQTQIGDVKVKQDKTTRELMIYRVPTSA